MSTSAVDTYAEANREHFDKTAKQYNNTPGAEAVARIAAEAMRGVYAFSDDEENGTVLLDFACGTGESSFYQALDSFGPPLIMFLGLVSQALAPYCKKIVGVDISQGMVDEFNSRVDNQGIPREEMHAVCLNILTGDGELSGQLFDVIVVCFSC